MKCLLAHVKSALVLLSLFTVMNVRADETIVSRLPSPQYLDSEVVTNIPFQSWQDGLCKFTYSLAFNATASNNVEMAFGFDADKDGELSDEEIDLVSGWDCGEWFLEDGAGETRFVSLPAGDDGMHEFSCAMRLRSSGRIEEVVYTDNSIGIFTDVATSKPSWIYSSRWNLIRIVARGDNIRGNERYSVRIDSKGLRIIFR